MAERKKPELGPVKDSSSADNTDLQDNRLDADDLEHWIKVIFDAKKDTVQQVYDTTTIHLKRMGVKPAPSKARAKCPEEGSTNVDPQSLYRWLEKLSKRHRKAVDQVKTIHATAARRLGV